MFSKHRGFTLVEIIAFATPILHMRKVPYARMNTMHWKLKLFIAVFGICPAIIVGTTIWYFFKISTPQKLTSISQITPVVPMKFPQSAQALDGETVFGPSALYFIAKIKMPRSDLHRFLAQPLINDDLSSTECELTEKYDPEIAKRGWKIDSIKKYLAGSLYGGQNATLQIKIDLDHREYVIVYLFYLN
jgi:hypothetical protein